MELLGWNEENLEDIRYVGYSYIKEGQYKIALTFFEALIVLHPDSAYDHQTLGALYLQMGDNMAALKTLERALELDPNHVPTQLNRVKTLFSLGYRDQALQAASALSQNEDTSVANQASALIEAYS
ncbi:MAG: tetratricopeptide repeat protein [Candidatus Algichlamydia australiensis]|nr:tetratricopeptide repeat protein [Chlamydiales bacterium]